MFDLSNRGAAALEESGRLFIYTLLLYRKNTFCPHIFHPSMFPLFWYVAQEVLAVLYY